MKNKRYIKNNKQRKLYKKTELFQKVLKSLFRYVKDIFLKLIVQKLFLLSFSLNCFKTSIKNFCIISGRSRGVFRKTKVSRIMLKQLGAEGLFFGLQKLS